MDYANYDDNAVMTNMIANILATVEYGEATMEELLHQGKIRWVISSADRW